MNLVVNGEGTGTDFHLDGYDIIGKTGTAEVYNDATGYYYSSYEHSIRSFAGMYPKDNPKYIFYIAFKDLPTSTPMSNAVKSLMQDLEAYYNLTNVKANARTYNRIDNYLNKNVFEVKNVLDVNGVPYELIGDGDKIINQYPLGGNLLNGKLLLLTNGNFTETNLLGYSSKMVNQYCKMVNIPCNVKGNGYVSQFSYEKDETGKVILINAVLDQKYKDIIGN